MDELTMQSIYIYFADVRQKQNHLHLFFLTNKPDIYGYMWGFTIFRVLEFGLKILNWMQVEAHTIAYATWGIIHIILQRVYLHCITLS